MAWSVGPRIILRHVIVPTKSSDEGLSTQSNGLYSNRRDHDVDAFVRSLALAGML